MADINNSENSATRRCSRKDPRAFFHNYSGGDYFVTICTYGRRHYFGAIINGKMEYTDIGRYAVEQISELSSHYPYVEILLSVVMPNHIHALIHILDEKDCKIKGIPYTVPGQRTALGVVVGGYKQAVTRYARRNDIEFFWQSRYHDHIVRNNIDGNRIAEYIENNIQLWNDDCYCKES